MFPKLYSSRFRPRLYCPDGRGFWSGHLPFAADLIDALRPSLLVELGAYYGESYFGFCQAIQECGLACRAFAIDNWSGDLHTGNYGSAVYDSVQAHNGQHYAAFSTLVKASFDDAAGRFEDGSLHLLHLDGCHTYAAVKHDFDTWLPKVSSRGIILVHDIAVHQENFGVWQFWEEISGKFPSFAFLHSSGLGVLARDADRKFDNGFLESLLGGASDAQAIRDHYELCAQALAASHRIAPGRAAVFQVFWPGTLGYAEGRSAREAVPFGEWCSVNCMLPAFTGRLRLDPGDAPAVVEIASATLESASTRKILWSLDSREVRAVTCGGTAVRIPDTERLLILSYGNDPQIYLPKLAVKGDLRFSCSIRMDTDVRFLEDPTGQSTRRCP